MTAIKFTFSLDSHGGLQPKARLWVDANADDTLSPNEEVELDPQALTWTGAANAGLTPLSQITFYLKYYAAIGTHWKLKVTTGEGESLKVHYQQTGTVGFQPSFVAGRLDDA